MTTIDGFVYQEEMGEELRSRTPRREQGAPVPSSRRVPGWGDLGVQLRSRAKSSAELEYLV